ncbi:glycosyltransferase [Brachybacterium sp. Marseille-Q7125]|uniref:glycosyltransferase n=1 Tax=Brachybacterium sp. Marseille-Q7125 TaxID=2932815 RepID=UPI001FF3D10D|nr:glycosyltransferase [Brachybacterium sp. Marseille-Q7125]
MSPDVLRIAAICLHTSPLDEPGAADAGGMNVVVLEQSRALARRGHTVEMFTRRSSPDQPDTVEVAERLRLHYLDAGPAEPLAKSAMEQAITPFREQLRARFAALTPATEDPAHPAAPHSAGSTGDAPTDTATASSATPVDLIHSHHWFSGVAALPVARELGIPHLQSYHSVAAPEGSRTLDAGEPAESGGRLPGERFVAQGSDLVIAVSTAEARTVAERYDVPETRLATARPGVDAACFRPCEDLRERREQPRLLFTARLQPLKAPDLALEILAHLDPALEARLVLAGGVSQDFSDYLTELRERAQELGIADRVDFVGSLDRDALADQMRCATALLLTSWSETFGLVALEAQASGTPVMAWRCAGGVREAVGPDGLILESRDPDVWAEALQTLLADQERYARAVASSREFAISRSWDATALALETAYRTALPSRPAGDS